MVLEVHKFAPDRGHCIREEREIHMPGLESSSSGKKPYHRPMCTLKSVAEVSALVREKGTDHANTAGASGTFVRTVAPILLAEGYEDDLRVIGQRARMRANVLERSSILDGTGPVEMLFATDQGAASPESFLLLDLRNRRNEARGLPESIGGHADLGPSVPLLILVNSMEQFQGWRGMDAEHCWQLRGHPSPANLATALRCFLHLCATFTQCPPAGGPSLDEAAQNTLSSEVHRK